MRSRKYERGEKEECKIAYTRKNNIEKVKVEVEKEENAERKKTR